MAFEQTIKNLDNCLRTDKGCTSELDYVEQTSWILFLKYLDDLEKSRRLAAELQDKTYDPIIAEGYRWNDWAMPLNAKGENDVFKALVGDDLIEFVDGKPVSAEEFLNTMFGQMPSFFSSLEDLQERWSAPKTREELLDKMDEAGYGKDVLKQIRTLIDAENCDLLDVLEYISFNVEPIERAERVRNVDSFRTTLSAAERDFVNYIINLYIKEGIEELGSDKLPAIISMKYGSIPDGMRALGGVDAAKSIFLGFQKNLYLNSIAA